MPSFPVRPGLEFNFESETFILILKGLAFNALVSLAALGAFSVLDQFDEIKQFNVGSTAAYFNRLSFANFWIFFKQHCIEFPIVEEMTYRLPVSLMITWKFRLPVGNKDMTKYALWLALIIPTWFFASTHDPFQFPVLISGLTFGWLIIKTKPSWPWPAVICHSLANLSIYVVVKILQMAGYAPIN